MSEDKSESGNFIFESLMCTEKLGEKLKFVGIVLAEGRWDQAYYTKEEIKKAIKTLEGKFVDVEHGNSKLFEKKTVGKITKTWYDEALKVGIASGYVTDPQAIHFIKEKILRGLSCFTRFNKDYTEKHGLTANDLEIENVSLVNKPACITCYITHTTEKLSKLCKGEVIDLEEELEKSKEQNSYTPSPVYINVKSNEDFGKITEKIETMSKYIEELEMTIAEMGVDFLEEIEDEELGQKVITIKRKGAMIGIIKGMGYGSLMEMPDAAIKTLAKKLVAKYGTGRAFRMANAQVIYRKSMQEPARAKFKKLVEYIRAIIHSKKQEKSSKEKGEVISEEDKNKEEESMAEEKKEEEAPIENKPEEPKEDVPVVNEDGSITFKGKTFKVAEEKEAEEIKEPEKEEEIKTSEVKEQETKETEKEIVIKEKELIVKPSKLVIDAETIELIKPKKEEKPEEKPKEKTDLEKAEEIPLEELIYHWAQTVGGTTIEEEDEE